MTGFSTQGLVIKNLTFLKNKNISFKTVDLLPSKKFFNQLENQFINASSKKRLSSVEFENEKNKFLESADSKLILYGLKNQTDTGVNKVIIVSEETEGSNDNKSFKKLPAIGKILELEVITLPIFLKRHDGIELEIKK